MSAKHTLGPWRVTRCSDRGFPHQIEDCQESPVARAALHDDARLIAAAPDLLRELQAWVDLMGPAEVPGTEGSEWLKRARAAIAQATGEQA